MKPETFDKLLRWSCIVSSVIGLIVGSIAVAKGWDDFPGRFPLVVISSISSATLWVRAEERKAMNAAMQKDGGSGASGVKQ